MKKGFTLVELMIVIVVIGMLAMVAVPKFADLLASAREGGTKGHLGSLRSAVTIYYSQTEGIYPSDNLLSLVPLFINEIPVARLPPYHGDSAEVHNALSTATLTDFGGWAYNNVSSSPQWGSVFVNCLHKDSKGYPWTSH